MIGRTRPLALLAAMLLVARAALAQVPGPAEPLSLPPAGARCENASADMPADAPRGASAYSFSFGVPAAQIRLADGTLIAAGSSPREIDAAFDSLGRIILLRDNIGYGLWRSVTVVASFPRDGPAQGFRMELAADSAALMAVAQREGLQAALAAVPQTGRRTQLPLDTADLRRARVLADTLWSRRCR